jgi:DNA-binding response OmpR family regulator
VRVVIAEDSVLLREGISRILDGAGLDVVGLCDTAEELLQKTASYSPDVAIVDIRLPPTHNDEGLQAALEIRARHPSVSVLVLSQYVEVGLAMKLLYLPRPATLRALRLGLFDSLLNRHASAALNPMWRCEALPGRVLRSGGCVRR